CGAASACAHGWHKPSSSLPSSNAKSSPHSRHSGIGSPSLSLSSRAVARRSSSRRPTRAHVLLDLPLRVLDRLESCRTGVVAMATKERPTLPPNLPWQPPTGLAHDGPIAERRAAVRGGRPVQTVVATALAAGASSTHVFGPASSASSFEANG